MDYLFFLRWFFILVGSVFTQDHVSWDCPYQPSGGWYVCEYQETGWKTYVRFVGVGDQNMREFRLVSPENTTMAVVTIGRGWMTWEIWMDGIWLVGQKPISIFHPLLL